MQNISGYAILEKIAETKNSIVYRGRKEGEDRTVIIKTLTMEFPTVSAMARFKQEYEIIKGLSISGVVAHLDLVDFKNSIALVLEDFQGVSLKKFMQGTAIDIEIFLNMGISLARTLGELHTRNIVHRDIKPQNIIVDPKNSSVKITDFGIAAELTRENEDLYNPEVVEGTLAYMSPEQTGRMNRSVDYRTDLYSLGITFYEMLTGAPPFQSEDPMELMHSHIARLPRALAEVSSVVPRVVSEIIMKLLAKTAEERYQNSFGLAADLEECRKQFKKKGTVDDFILATKDISLKFNIPQVLIGREAEVNTLLAAFERVCDRPEDEDGDKHTMEMMLVLGHPGIGKSALINEIHKPIVARHGYFITGKYDQFRKDVPYSAIIQGFMGLVNQILAESDEMIKAWRENLLKALGPNGRVITEVIPAVEHIIGPQKAVRDLGPEESQNRFNLTFKNFTGVLTRSGRPLVLFLDDLQWADSASLKLLHVLVGDADFNNFLIIGAYRDTEVSEGHPLMMALDDIHRTGATVGSLLLEPLKVEHVKRLIANFLRSPEDVVGDLSSMIYKKTGGNPFFISQFLKTLYDNNYLFIDPARGWGWDIEKISTLQVTDNVVELMAQKITSLSEATREILKICSCIGNRFDLESLAAILEVPIDKVLGDITGAMEEGLVHRIGDIYRFHHDRIQEAAYSLIPEGSRAAMHLRIGNFLLEKTGEGDLSKKILYIVNHFNMAISLLVTEEERNRAAGLNLQAAQKARHSAAYDSAHHYANTGIGLIISAGKDINRKKHDAWKNNYELISRLHGEAVVACCLLRKYDEMNVLGQDILKYSSSFIDKGKFYKMLVLSLVAQGKQRESLQKTGEGVRMLGFSFPRRISPLHVLIWILSLELRLRNKTERDLLALPDMPVSRKWMALQILLGSGGSVFISKPLLIPFYCSRGVKYMLQEGMTPVSCFSIMTFGFTMIFLGRIDKGYHYGRLGMRILEEKKYTEWAGAITYNFWSFIAHWKGHLRETLPGLLNGYHRGLEDGDFDWAPMSLMSYCYQSFIAGIPLGELDAEIRTYRKTIENMKHEISLNSVKIVSQVVANLMGDSSGALLFNGPHYYVNVDKHMHVIFIYRLMLGYIFEDYALALENAKLVRRRLVSFQATPFMGVYFLYDPLTRLAIYSELPRKKRKKEIKRIRKSLSVLKKYAHHAPMNYAHQVELVSAELARVEGRFADAVASYERAINGAHANGYLNHEALANERAARFWMGKQNEKVAQVYMTSAHQCYNRWGARAKAADLEKRYPELIVRQTGTAFTGTETNLSSTSSSFSGTQSLDLQSIMKSARAIASEMDLEILLKKTMEIALQNSGAQKGYFLIKNETTQKLHIEAKASSDGNITALQSIPVDAYPEIPQSLVNYVGTTLENVILNDVSLDERFSQDPCITKNNVKSILCTPIRHKGVVSGIIYLENSLTTNAFTPERLQVLQIFSSQSAIAIENARLVGHRENAARLQTEMKIAANIQTSLIPAEPHIAGYDIIGFMKPADEVGGDYYDVINAAGRDWLVIGDVSGHGVPAGLFMMMAQTLIQMAVDEKPDRSPADLLAAVNKVIARNMKKLGEDKYMTITVFACHNDGRFYFTGLHQDILVYRHTTGRVEPIETNGMWIGMMDDISECLPESELRLEKNDVMLLYTDGIIEAWKKGSVKNKRNPEEEMFGDKLLKEILRDNGAKPLNAIKSGILRALEDYTINDDVTMVVLKRLV